MDVAPLPQAQSFQNRARIFSFHLCPLPQFLYWDQQHCNQPLRPRWSSRLRHLPLTPHSITIQVLLTLSLEDFQNVLLLNWHHKNFNSLSFFLSLWLLQPPPCWPTSTRITHLSNLSVSPSPLCQSLHCLVLTQCIQLKILTATYKAILNSILSYMTSSISKYHPNCPLRSSQSLLLSSPLVTSSQAFFRVPLFLWISVYLCLWKKVFHYVV